MRNLLQLQNRLEALLEEAHRKVSSIAGAARTSPHGLVQQLLNRRGESPWGFVSNGLMWVPEILTPTFPEILAH